MKNLGAAGTKCLLVQTEFSEFSFWNYREVCRLAGSKYPATPLGLLTAAALLPEHWELRLVDENVEPLRDSHLEWADIVCTGGMLPQQKNMLALIERTHAFGTPVVVGGPEATSQPELYAAADYLVLGEGEITIPLLLDALSRGEAGGVFRSDHKADMSQAVVPRYDLISFRDYMMVGVQFVRGCPFNCEFCDIIELYGRKARYKEDRQILRELQCLYDLGHRGHVDFVDDNFVGDRKRAKSLLRQVVPWLKERNHPFFFTTEASVNLAEDDELLALMKDADFRYVFLGIETPETEALRESGKTQNLRKSIPDVVNKLLSYGIFSNGGFIIGFDGESENVAQNIVSCIQEAGICMAMVGLLYALPNTRLTRRLLSEGRLHAAGSQITGKRDIDQSTSGLNFDPVRPRERILSDFVFVLEHVYDPASYFRRVTYNGLQARPSNGFRPDTATRVRYLRAFLKVVAQLGFGKKTALPFWKMILTVIARNPRALEGAVNLGAMYIHFGQQKDYVVKELRGCIREERRGSGAPSGIPGIQGPVEAGRPL